MFSQHQNNGEALKEVQIEYEKQLFAYKSGIPWRDEAPNDATSHERLGYILEKLGRQEEAIEEYKKAITIDSNFIQAHANLGFSYYALKLYKESIESFESACKLTDFQNHLLVAPLAANYAECNDFNKAVEYQEKAIELVSNNEFVGIGINLSIVNGSPVIEGILPNTPASKSSLATNDIIEAVDGISTKDVPLDDVISKIKGLAGTEVILTVRHLGKDTCEDIIINRDKIANPIMAEYEKRLESYKAHKPWRE